MSDTNLVIRLDIKTTREELINFIVADEESEECFEPGEKYTKESFIEYINTWTIEELVNYVDLDLLDTVHARLDFYK